MAAYIAILEDAGPDTAVGVWFPDLPGCFSAGDSVDEALRNAKDALAAYAEVLATEGRSLPPARTLSVLRNDAAVAPDIRDHIVALIPFPAESAHAAE
jgi:predicted RNase H-like HicB family nuclease